MRLFQYEIATQCLIILRGSVELGREVETWETHKALQEKVGKTTSEARRRKILAEIAEMDRQEIVIDRMWFWLQSIIVAAANVSKLIWGEKGRAHQRRRPLIEALGVGSGSPFKSPDLRNSFEHFDERLDD
jgi:hypothetical protein